MTITATIHRPTRMDASEVKGTAWLKIMTNVPGEDATIFMPYEQAVAVAAAFNSYNEAQKEAAG